MAGQKILSAQVRYLNEVGEDKVFELITTGSTLKEIWDKYNCGSRGFYKWLRQVEGRKARYYEARRQAADFLADEILDIADADMDPTQANLAKLRIDSRKWWASRVSPDKWGDKKSPALQINLNDMHLEALKDISVIEQQPDALITDESDEDVIED